MSSVIESKENGPYIVKNLQSLTDAKGADILPDKKVIALCRCGKSNNKPFCDGTHAKIGFSSETNNPAAGKWQDYVGKHITIHDNRHLCAHAGNCTHGLDSVWRMGKKPWIDPDGASVEAIIAVIEQCPSGALSYSIDGNTSPMELWLMELVCPKTVPKTNRIVTAPTGTSSLKATII